MAGKYSIVLDGDCREPLEQLALALGYLWGDGPNVRALMQAIAQRQQSVGNAVVFTSAQQQALAWAAIAAWKKGAWTEAMALGNLFESLPGIDRQIADSVAARLEPLKQKWVCKVFEAIEQKQSFKLAYQDAADRPFQFSVCGAQFVPHDRRTYLDCWCLETEGNMDIPQLQHNWCLRLDRITDAEIIPIKKKWRSYLDTAEIEMVISSGLAHAYEPRPEDTLIEWVEGDQKRVKRFITNSFWFIREILPYGKDCQVIGPPEIRDRIRTQLVEAAWQYE
jgi:predicted DNA-binding transcriptional regulator YafY